MSLVPAIVSPSSAIVDKIGFISKAIRPDFSGSFMSILSLHAEIKV